MAATWGTPTTWADFLTWNGDTGPAPDTGAIYTGSTGGFYTPPVRKMEDPYLLIAVLDDDLLLL